MPPRQGGVLVGNEMQIWVAALPKAEALSAVRAKFPSDYDIKFSVDQFTEDEIAKLKLPYGTICDLSEVPIYWLNPGS